MRTVLVPEWNPVNSDDIIRLKMLRLLLKGLFTFFFFFFYKLLHYARLDQICNKFPSSVSR